MLKASGSLGAATMLSRILGMVRVMIYARFMGDTWVASAFYFAFQIPNLFRRLLGEGALSAALVPILKETEVRQGRDSMWQAASAALSLIFCLCSASVLLLAGICSLALWLGEGMTERNRLFFELLRLMSPYVLMVCLAAVLMGICNVRGHFFVPALGATMLNVIAIAAVLVLAPLMGTRLEDQIFGLVAGVLLAGLVQMVFQLPLLAREGFRPRFTAPWRHPSVGEISRRMAAGIVGVAAFQINVVFTQWIAFRQEDHIVASYEYAVRLMELPQGVIGISLATFMLTALSGLAARNRYPEFCRTLKEGMGHVIFANCLAASMLFVLAEPIVRLLFQYGEFDETSTERCRFALRCLVPGLVSFSLVNVAARAYFAMGDVKTPMRYSVYCFAANAALAIPLVPYLEEGGLGIANTISSMLNLCLLALGLRRRLPQLSYRDMLGSLGAVLAAAAAAGCLAWGCHRWIEGWMGHEALSARLAGVFAPLILGGVLYLGLSLWWRVGSAQESLSLASSLARRLFGGNSRND